MKRTPTTLIAITAVGVAHLAHYKLLLEPLSPMI
jgi:hypothetical protein